MCKRWEILRWSLHQPAWFLQKMALKQFAKDDNDLEGWLQTVKKFSYDIGMSFGLDKLTGVISVELHWNTVIKDLKQEEVQISWRWWKEWNWAHTNERINKEKVLPEKKQSWRQNSSQQIA